MGDSLLHQEYGRTRIQWLASLNTEYYPPTQFRRTSIICTIGETSHFIE
jgi:pyruvate kinase